MNISIYFFGFFFAASIGSFYVTLAERILLFFYSKERKKYSFIHKFQKIIFERSSCNHCKTTIKVTGLIPVLGFFLVKKKCPNCETTIPKYYPISETLFGLAFCVFYYLTGNLFFCISVVFLIGHLQISVFTDWKYFSLDYENLPFISGFGLIANFFLDGKFFGINEIFTFAGFVVFYLCLYFFYQKGIGLGDVFFAPVFAFLSTHPWWILFLNSSYISAVLFTFLFRKKGQSMKKIPIPMGVYFSFGLITAYIARSIFLKTQNI